MVASAKISEKHPPSGRLKQTKGTFLLPFRLHGATKSAITRLSLVPQISGCVHFVPNVILRLMKYWLSILNKNGGRCGKSEVYFAENEAVFFIAS